MNEKQKLLMELKQCVKEIWKLLERLTEIEIPDVQKNSTEEPPPPPPGEPG